jgi:hypothetical protein
MRKRAAVIAAIGLAAAVLAAAGVAAALTFLGSGIFGPSTSVMSQGQVHKDLAELGSATSSRSASPAPSRSPKPSSPAVTTTARTFQGNSVYASCSAGRATLANLIPAPGYAIDDAAHGPATAASVRFRSGTTEVLVTVTCSGDRPKFASHVEAAGADVDQPGGGGGGGAGDDGGRRGRGGGSGGGGHGGDGDG